MFAARFTALGGRWLSRSPSAVRSSSSSCMMDFSRRSFASDASLEGLLRTPLYDTHLATEGAKMVPYAGYAMPVQFKESIADTHRHCRTDAVVFDVSHMGQVRVHGSANHTTGFVERITPADVVALNENQGRLSLITTEQGTIMDDCIVTKRPDHIGMVLNGACKFKDLAHMQQQAELYNAEHGGDVSVEYLEDTRGLIALQGPKAAEVLQCLLPRDVPALSELPFMYAMDVPGLGGLSGVVTVTRCGYTGEDGFELSVQAEQTPDVWNLLLEDKSVMRAGLAARDTLRLEAGLCLYGNDIDETTTPVEAVLMWTISKRRREEGGFIGHEVIMAQFRNKSNTRKRVGLTVLTGAPARQGAEIVDSETGETIGTVTSGTASPLTKQKISMGYIAKSKGKAGTQVQVRVRNKLGDAVVAKLPFVPGKYYAGP